MQTLDKRITALEQARPTETGPFFIHLVAMGSEGGEIQRITKGNHEWLRQPEESEDELKSRAEHEAGPPKVGCVQSFFCW